MNFKATSDNVILKVTKKKNIDPLAVDTGEEPILLGKIIAVGPYADQSLFDLSGSHMACVYKARVAALPWTTDDEEFYVVKEENIYGILE